MEEFDADTPNRLPDSMCASQKAYIESGNSKKTLCALCYGLKVDSSSDEPLFDIDQEPFSNMPGLTRRDLKPVGSDMKAEVIRRASVLEIEPVPRPNHWGNKQCQKWLVYNPITNTACIAFLTQEVKNLKDAAVAAAAERAAEEAEQTGAWRGSVPYLRLIMCLLEDEIKSAFLDRARARTRQEIDARNSEQREATAFEKLAGKWNDRDFNPICPVSNVHPDFVSPIDCGFEKVKDLAPANATKVENYIADFRKRLVRIIDDWERSGNGDSGYDSRNLSFGSLRDRTAVAMESRKAFLRHDPPHILMFWELADKYQFLDSALQRIDSSMAAPDASSVPSVIGRRKRKSDVSLGKSDGGDDEVSVALSKLANQFHTLSSNRMAQLRKSISEHMRGALTATPGRSGSKRGGPLHQL